MGTAIYVTNDSFKDIMAKFTIPPYLISNTGFTKGIPFTRTLVNLQLRLATSGLIREITKTVLKDLERNLKIETQEKGNWALYFSIITLLCLVAEEVQIALNGYRAFLKGNNVDEFSNHQHSLNVDGQELEFVGLQTCSHYFHDHFNSDKSASGRRAPSFNPIREAPQNHTDLDFDQPSRQMAEELRKFVEDYGKHQSDDMHGKN